MDQVVSPLKFVLTGFLFLLLISVTQAQFVQLPVDHSEIEQVNREHLKLQVNPISLPFWDDFASGKIDSLKWESEGVVASKTVGIDPPSIGVVYLDGVDILGKPYSAVLLENGRGDQLASRAIDLSLYKEADSLYLSFFWQAGGKGEMPDDNDQLELYFLDQKGEWVLVWDVFGGDLSKKETFTQEMLKVGASFMHSNFRFRFINNGRLSGPFDTWVLDYIFLDRGRRRKDIYFEDRTLTKALNSPFGKYNALPLSEWNKNKKQELKAISSQFKNLSNRFRAMEYSLVLRDKATRKVLQHIHVQTPFNPVPQALERRDFTGVSPDKADFKVSKEFDLETVLYLTNGDGFLVEDISGGDTLYSSQVDFRVNDTLTHTLPIRDFFAYDNGSLDYAAGINQRSGMLALRYEVENPSALKGISINFANFSQIGMGLELMVWDDLDAPPLFSEEVLIPSKDRLDELVYFALDTNITVSDAFYIGFTQFTNDFIYVGLDKSNDTGDEVYFNVTGSWEQNKEVRGSLMMRPHLAVSPKTPDNAGGRMASLTAYPNPVSDKLYLEGEIDEIKVFDSYGRQINIGVESFEEGKILNFTGSEKGVYVVRAWTGGKPNSIRILVK